MTRPYQKISDVITDLNAMIQEPLIPNNVRRNLVDIVWELNRTQARSKQVDGCVDSARKSYNKTGD